MWLFVLFVQGHEGLNSLPNEPGTGSNLSGCPISAVPSLVSFLVLDVLVPRLACDDFAESLVALG